MSRRIVWLLIAVVLSFNPIHVQADVRDGHKSRVPLHFSHPLVAESPSPDTKIRVDHMFTNLAGDEGEQHTVRLEGEYAFNRSLSVEINAPYSFLNPGDDHSVDRLGNVDVGLKYANYTFEDHGVLVGGGIELVLPTGNEEKGIGSDHVAVIEPFVDAGYAVDQWELVGFLAVGFPTNTHSGEHEPDAEVEWSLSAMCHFCPGVVGALELDGEYLSGGEENGDSFINITPGVKVQPLEKNPNLLIGLGIRLPLTSNKEFHSQTIFSVFYHF